MNSCFLFVLILAITLLFVALVSAFGMTRGTRSSVALNKTQPAAPETEAKEPVAKNVVPPAKVATKPAVPTSLISPTPPADIKSMVQEMAVGSRITVVIKSDRCPWCGKFMSVLHEMQQSEDHTLGKIYVVDAGKDTKTAVGSIVGQGMQQFRGLPHSVIIDRQDSQYVVASFGGYVPREKVGEALANATKSTVEVVS